MVDGATCSKAKDGHKLAEQPAQGVGRRAKQVKRGDKNAFAKAPQPTARLALSYKNSPVAAAAAKCIRQRQVQTFSRPEIW